MFSVLLADDEQAVLDSLISSISWQQLGVDTLLQASDGVSALDILRKNHVDLLITDIKMPRMDGLELLTRVRAEWPRIHCILLTAYSEFEYAKTAIHLGVENYLLKPFLQSELEETVEKALDNLYAGRHNSERLFPDNTLLRWANGTMGSNELSERASILQLNIWQRHYCCICARKFRNDYSLSSFAETCARRAGPLYDIRSFWDGNDRCVMIVGGRKIEPDALASFFSKTAEEMSYRAFLSLAAGPVVNGSDNLPESYRAACGLSDAAIHFGGDNFYITSLPAERGVDRLTSCFYKLFSIKDTEEREDGYRRLADALSSEYGSRYDLVSVLTGSLIQIFRQEFSGRTELQKKIHSRLYLFHTSETGDLKTSLTELLEYVCLQYRYYFEELSPIVRSAVNFIHGHYRESLSIKEFCVRNRMNAAYFGWLFRKETGMFFNNYLTQYRILGASRLLADTDIQVNDIAERVGFSSTNYFISCFKKQTGMSPSEYRTAILRQNDTEGW